MRQPISLAGGSTTRAVIVLLLLLCVIQPTTGYVTISKSAAHRRKPWTTRIQSSALADHESSSSLSNNNNKVGLTATASSVVKQKTNELDDVITTVAETTDSGVRKEFTPFQTLARTLPVVTAVAYFLDPQPLDSVVQSAWSAICDWDVARMPLFEAEVATFGFYWAIVFFSGLHLFLGPEKTMANRLDGKPPHDPFSWLRVENWHEWFNPTFAYLGSIFLYLQIHEKPPLPEIAPTFGVLAAETIFGVWLYDLCFFPIHYVMHHTNLGSMRKIHGYHHRHPSSHSLNSLEVVQHSYIDGFLQVVVNIAVQHVSPFGGPKHTFSRLLHNLLVTYLLAEAHSGYDLPWMSHNVYPEILGGAPRHDRHHQIGRVYYQQYFKYLDDFFGFTDEAINDNKSNKKKKSSSNSKKNASLDDNTIIPRGQFAFVSKEEKHGLTDPSTPSSSTTSTDLPFFATRAA